MSSTPSTNPNVALCFLDGFFDDRQIRSKLHDAPCYVTIQRGGVVDREL